MESGRHQRSEEFAQVDDCAFLHQAKDRGQAGRGCRAQLERTDLADSEDPGEGGLLDRKSVV